MKFGSLFSMVWKSLLTERAKYRKYRILDQKAKDLIFSPCLAIILRLIPGLGRSPGEGNDNSLQHSCLENPFGNACTPVVDSCRCMAKPIQYCKVSSVQFSSVQSLSHVRLFAIPWIAARQASLFITISRSSLRLTSIESVMPSSHLILGHPLLWGYWYFSWQS